MKKCLSILGSVCILLTHPQSWHSIHEKIIEAHLLKRSSQTCSRQSKLCEKNMLHWITNCLQLSRCVMCCFVCVLCLCSSCSTSTASDGASLRAMIFSFLKFSVLNARTECFCTTYTLISCNPYCYSVSCAHFVLLWQSYQLCCVWPRLRSYFFSPLGVWFVFC